MLLEIACFNLESALIAQKAGADRIELCEDYLSGGITPSEDIIEQARRKISIPLFVMIRPRSGNFIYNEDEFEKMKQAVIHCKEVGVDGVVLGILNSEGNVDREKCMELVKLAQPMQVTFHRAFDETKEPLNAMDEIISCGFHRVLTSGQRQFSLHGARLISSLIMKAGKRIAIMPGGGIRSVNISTLITETAATEYHSSAINPATLMPDENEIRKLKEFLEG